MKFPIFTCICAGVMALAVSPGVPAQSMDGTYGDCVTAYSDLMADYGDRLMDGTNDVLCQVTKGEALVLALGVDAVEQVPLYARGEFTNIGGQKSCTVTLYYGLSCPTDPEACLITEYANLSLSGGDGAAWNKFLKGQGCQDAMTLTQ